MTDSATPRKNRVASRPLAFMQVAVNIRMAPQMKLQVTVLEVKTGIRTFPINSHRGWNTFANFPAYHQHAGGIRCDEVPKVVYATGPWVFLAWEVEIFSKTHDCGWRKSRLVQILEQVWDCHNWQQVMQQCEFIWSHCLGALLATCLTCAIFFYPLQKKEIRQIARGRWHPQCRTPVPFHVHWRLSFWIRAVEQTVIAVDFSSLEKRRLHGNILDQTEYLFTFLWLFIQSPVTDLHGRGRHRCGVCGELGKALRQNNGD